jgi:hypothetical protein
LAASLESNFIGPVLLARDLGKAMERDLRGMDGGLTLRRDR